MAVNETARVTPESLTQGIKPFQSNVSTQFLLDPASSNISTGFEDGLHPRYGLAPVPGHFVQLAPKSPPGFVNLREAEQTSNNNYISARTRVSGLFTFQLTDSTYQKKSTFPVWVIDGVLNTPTSVTIPISYAAPATTSGFSYSLEQKLQAFSVPNVRANTLSSSTAAPANSWYLKSAAMTVAGQDNQSVYAFAPQVDNTVASTTQTAMPTGWQGGVHSDWQTGNFSKRTRAISLYNFVNGTGIVEMGFQYTYGSLPASNATLYASTPDLSQSAGPANKMNFGTQTATQINRLSGAAPATTSIVSALLEDPDGIINSGYSVLFTATKTGGQGLLLNDWIASVPTNYSYVSTEPTTKLQPFDPHTPILFPKDYQTGYTQNGVVTPSCFAAWPTFTSGTALVADASAPTDGSVHVALGAAGSGILRANSVYEFTLSFTDKTTGYTSNVGSPARVQTGTPDFVAISLYRPPLLTGVDIQACPFASNTNGAVSNPFIFPQPSQSINTVDVTVYYRAFGSYEWLPCFTDELAKVFYYPNWGKVWACSTGVAALPGGQPGGFNDYSALPRDNWSDVLNFRGRAFWASSTQVVWSYQDNPLAYAARNSVGCPSGSFKGMFTHAYPGQAEQAGRLVVFGTDAVYVGRFLGTRYASQLPVTVSPGDTISFPAEGSDFVLDTWSSNTAYSSRAVCSALGVLLYWGPLGVFEDNGVNFPRKISLSLEPYLFELVDKNATDSVHCIYNDSTKQVIWFYTPPVTVDATQSTRCLVYSTIENAFLPPWKFTGLLVDWSQLVTASTSSASLYNSALGGSRVLVGYRSTANPTGPQEVAFFDQMNDCGDVPPSGIFPSFSQITGGAGQIQLNADTFADTMPAISVGSALTLSGTLGYQAPGGFNFDGIYTVVVAGSNNIILQGQAGSTYPANTSFAQPCPYYPALSAFPLSVTSEYYAPGGLMSWYRWISAHYMIRVARLFTNATYQIQVTYQTLIGGASTPVTFTLVQNSKGNFQVLNMLPFSQQNAEGQALSLTISTPSGTHNGGRWTLQYLGYDVAQMAKGNLKLFEG